MQNNESKVINIPTSVDKIFKQYLTIVNGVFSKEKRLWPIEIDVLDKLLIIDYMYKHLSKEQRDKILFHKETKDRIRASLLNMSTYSYDNVLTRLRKKGMLKGKSLSMHIPITSDGKIDLQFKLKITDEQEN